MSRFFDFTKEEQRVLARLKTPARIQDYLNTLPINFEDTYLSPRQVLARQTAHCAEGAIFAAVALWFHGYKPLLLDLETSKNDECHVVALFRVDGYWGAISKTNHAVLRYREPVYSTVRELALSYFHEYFLHSGKKTLRTYSRPFDLSKIKDRSWLTGDNSLGPIINLLDASPHFDIASPAQIKRFRSADPIEIAAGKLVEWKAPR